MQTTTTSTRLQESCLPRALLQCLHSHARRRDPVSLLVSVDTSSEHLINLNVDYVSPSCIMPDGVWPLFSGGFYTLIVIPIIPFMLCGLLYILARLWARYVKRERILGIRCGFMVASPELAYQYGLRCFKASVPFPGIVYNNMCQLVFNVFSCQELRNGVFVMAAAPAIVCWESETHRGLVVAAIMALFVYVIGVPVFTLGTVLYARRKDLLRHPDFLLAFGFFYTWYSKRPQASIPDTALNKTNPFVACRAPLLLVGNPAVHPKVLSVPLCCRVSLTSCRPSGAD